LQHEQSGLLNERGLASAFGATIAARAIRWCCSTFDPAPKEIAMARSKDMQQALDIVAGRKLAPAERPKWSGLARIGLLLWTGVGIMTIGLVALFALG
jgi:hypothetical protein